MNAIAQSQTKTRRRNAAFTLIEVTLAVGITSVALVALLAMVPQGIATMKRATDIAVEARIHQQIHAQISLVPWERRFQFHNTIRYYDDQGIMIDAQRHQADSDEFPRVYIARVLVPQGGTLPTRVGGAQYEPVDLAGDKSKENEVQLILVEISNSPLVEALEDFDNQNNWRHMRTYRSTLTRTGDLKDIGL